MRGFLLAMMVAMLPAASAAAQQFGNVDKPPGGQRQIVEDGGRDDDRAKGPVRPAPNAMFAAIDGDGDGIITNRELRKAIRALRTLDADNDGNITLAEASPGAEQAGNAIAGPAGAFNRDAAGQNSDAATLIARFDLNNDRVLSADELPPRLAQMFGPGDDLNRNGAIEPAELHAFMARMGGNARAWAAGNGPNLQRTPFRDPNRRGGGRPGDQN